MQTERGVLRCTLRGRLKQERRRTDLVVVGDEVEVAETGDGEGAIEEVHPRRTKLSRRAPERRGRYREDVIVGNVDQVLVVFACTNPDPHLRMLDCFLVVAEENEVELVAVANKVDLVGKERARELFGIYEGIGYPVHYTSAREGSASTRCAGGSQAG